MGIGSTAAIVTIACAVLLRPLPYPDADRLFVLASPETSTQATDINVSQTAEVFHDLRDRIRSFETVAAHGGGSIFLFRFAIFGTND